MFESVVPWKRNLCGNILSEWNECCKDPDKNDCCWCAHKYFLGPNEKTKVIFKTLGPYLWTDKMVFLLIWHQMLVCFIGFFQLEQLGTSEYILTYSLETTDYVSHSLKI